MKVNEKQARELFEAIGYANAGDWSEKKLRAKLNDAAVFADAEKPEDGDMANLFLNVSKAAQDGETVELDGGGKPDPKKSSKGNKADRNGHAAGNGKSLKGNASQEGLPKKQREGLSMLDAAEKVLREKKKPMKCQDMIEAMSTKGYWSSPGGKTPAATLYSAFLREMATKKKDSRFKKVERGTFSLK